MYYLIIIITLSGSRNGSRAVKGENGLSGVNTDYRKKYGILPGLGTLSTLPSKDVSHLWQNESQRV